MESTNTKAKESKSFIEEGILLFHVVVCLKSLFLMQLRKIPLHFPRTMCIRGLQLMKVCNSVHVIMCFITTCIVGAKAVESPKKEAKKVNSHTVMINYRCKHYVLMCVLTMSCLNQTNKRASEDNEDNNQQKRFKRSVSEKVLTIMGCFFPFTLCICANNFY